MRRALILSVPLAVLALSPCSAAQEPPPVKRDPQSLTVVQRALTAMGGTIPADSVATGTITIVAGSRTDNGTIRILTRGPDQSAEHIQLPGEIRSVIYSRGQANEIL